MRITVLALMIVSVLAAPVCFASESDLQEAYALYYRGEKETAIKMMEEAVRERPDPGVFYFLGYAYYEMQQMDRANEYFGEAFRLKDFYSPMPPQ